MKRSVTARIGPSRIVDDVAVDTALINFSDSLDSRSSPLPQDSWLKIVSRTSGFQHSLICTIRAGLALKVTKEIRKGKLFCFCSIYLSAIFVCLFSGGRFTTKLYTWRLCHTIQPPIISYTILPETLPPSYTLDCKKTYPFHKPS